MCSHALAMQYEAQSRNMFGRELTLDEKQPSWMDGVHVHRPTDYRRDLKRYTMLHSATEEYWSQHRPNPEGPTVDDLTAGGLVPDDVYERPDLYTGYVGEPCYAETLRVLKAVRGNPGASVTIYRALPPGHTSISNGDWVSLSESYARQHAIQDDDPAHDWPIISASVPAHTVRYAGDDLMEYGYFGSPVTGRISSLQTDAGMFDWIPEAMVNHEIGEHLHPVDESYDPERDGDDLSPVAAMVKQATQCVCPICSDIMTSQVAGMSCMRCGTLVPYVSTEDLFVTFDEGEPVMERAGDTLKERYAGYYTEQDLIESWEASPEAQSGMTAEEALHALYAEQDPDLFPGLLKAKASATSFYARVRGVVRRVLLDDDGPKLDGRERVPAAEVLYPKWHPSKGLSPNDNSAFVAALGMRFRPSRTLPYPDKPNQATPRPVSNEGYLAKKKDQTVSPSEHGDPRLQDAGVTVSKTEDGKYYVHTHRARGKDRDSVADIPDSEIEFISSTGAKKPEAPEVSGVALLAADTGRVLMLQRSIDDKTAGGKWEFPGGHHEDGDLTSLHAAIREWQEEVGQPFPEGGYVAHTWTSPNGIYQGHVVVIPKEKGLVLHEGRVMENPDDPDSEWCEQVAWWDPLDAKKNPALREECKDSPWAEMIKAVAKKAAALIKQADEDQCPRCGEDYPGTVDLGKGWYGCPDCQISFTGPGDNVTIVPFGDLPEVSYDHPNYPSFVPAHD